MKRITIILTILLTSFWLTVYLLFYANFTTTKSINYGNCTVKYEYSFNNFRNDISNRETDGHGKSNEIEYIIAQHKLMKCLCDEYNITKDTSLKNHIISYVLEDELVKNYYIEEVIALDANLDNICKLKNEIFIYDSISLNLCDQYELTKEKSLIPEILKHYQNNRIARQIYCHLMDITLDKSPNIDSICKYKDSVFGPILIE